MTKTQGYQAKNSRINQPNNQPAAAANIQETQLSLTNRATHLCKCNGVVDLLKHAPTHMCYHAEFVVLR